MMSLRQCSSRGVAFATTTLKQQQTTYSLRIASFGGVACRRAIPRRLQSSQSNGGGGGGGGGDPLKHAKTRAGSGRMENEPVAGEDGYAGGVGMSMIPRGPVTWPALGLVAVAAAVAVAYYRVERERRLENAMGKIVSSESGWSPDPEKYAPRKFQKTTDGWFPEKDAFGVGKPAIGGEWSLIDLDGRMVTNKSFEGKWTLLYFGFARCPDICPSEMVKVGKVMDTLKKEHPKVAAQVQPLFVSIDPARDSLRALRTFAKDFHPSYIFLTGSSEQVQRMAKKYRVYVSKADETEDGDYLVDHSIVLYFHDDAGELADCFTQSMRPSDVVEKIMERMTVAAAAAAK